MRKMLMPMVVLALLIMPLAVAPALAQAPLGLDVSKSITPGEIYVDGTGAPDEATVTLRLEGTGDPQTARFELDVVFALDSSGSMSWNDPAGLRKDAAKSFVDKLDDTLDYAAVVSWDDNIDFSYILTTDFTTLKNHIDSVDASGGTNLDVGLNSAIAVLDAGMRPGAVQVIIFLTDGDGTYTHATAAAAAAKGYTVFPIGLGDSPNASILQDIADTTGGTYYAAPSAENLQEIFDLIATQVMSTAAMNVVVSETVQSCFSVVAGSWTVAPDAGYPVVNPDGTTTIQWSIPSLAIGDVWEVSFNVKCSEAGDDKPVDVVDGDNDSAVSYLDFEENEVTQDIPQVTIDVILPNLPPTADAGPDQSLEQTFYDGAEVMLDGSGSTDDGLIQPLTYTWTWDGESATGVNPTVVFPLGTTTVTLMVYDGEYTDTDTVDITVVDTTPPALTCVESVNPHGNTIPGEKRSDNAKSKAVNPDGFYEICVVDICDADPQLWIGTADDADIFVEGVDFDFDGCIVIKFTEAPGAAPSMKKIGSTNGQAGAVTYHITLPADPVVTAVDASGNTATCTCLVPPPPK